MEEYQRTVNESLFPAAFCKFLRSDVDCADAELRAALGMDKSEETIEETFMSMDELQTGIEGFEQTIKEVSVFMMTSNALLPVFAHQSSPLAINATMLQILSKSNPAVSSSESICTAKDHGVML